MSPTCRTRYRALARLLIVCLLAFPGPRWLYAQQEADPARGVDLPPALVEAGLAPAPEPGQDERHRMGLAEVMASNKPAPWPEAGAADPAGVLPANAARLIQDSASAAEKGESFRAVRLLRQAEEFAPDHPDILRALGVAYADSGNQTRAAAYLRRVISSRPNDTEALLILARHAAQSGPLEQALAYCQAIQEAQAPALIADYQRSVALSRFGYSTAAATCLSRVLQGIGEIDIDKLSKEGGVPALLLRELRVIKQIVPQLRIRQGDLLLRSGDAQRAAQAYAAVSLEAVDARYALVARRAYLALRANDKAGAIDQVIELLREPDAHAKDAQLVGYLSDQGVSAATLATRLEAMLADDGVTLSRLVALSLVAEKGRLLQPISGWLSNGPVTPGRLRQAVALLRFDDENPADAEALSGLLRLVAAVMQRSPEQASAYADAAISEVDAPITLLRAIRGGAYNAQPSRFTQLLAAVAYEQTLRRRDALAAYQLLLGADDALSQQALLPAVRLQLALGMGEQAMELIGVPGIEDSWPQFELAIRAMAASGQPREALALVDERVKALGKQLQLDLLRIEMIAQIGRPQEACNLLLRLISSQPGDESLYRLGIDLAYDHRADFSRITDADRMRRAFLTRLISNLPDSSLARIGMAQNIMTNPARFDEAERLLASVLEQEPENTGALSVMVDLYDSVGDEGSARAMHERYTQAIPPGVTRALLIAERAVTQGQTGQATAVLDRTLRLDEQGVLPGPAMTGDQASSLLHYLEAADPKRGTDELYLAMVRRFPQHAGLNNALGYRWAVQGKNLLQARAMIERALKGDPMSHSILDSLAWVQYKLGRFDEAKATQGRALMVLEALLARLRRPGLDLPDEMLPELGATTAILNDHMGDILFRLGDQRKAIDHWRIAMKQTYGDEEMQFDPELRSLAERLDAKIDAIADGQPVPVAEVPGPEAHGPAGHPADPEPQQAPPGG